MGFMSDSHSVDCILFIRFGRHFELPLLIQSFIMIAAMLMMLQLCTKIRRESDMSAKKRSFLGECAHDSFDNFAWCINTVDSFYLWKYSGDGNQR